MASNTEHVHISWTSEQKKLLQRWGEQAKSLTWMHNQASKSYTFYHNTTSVLSIALSGSAGTGSFFTDSEIPIIKTLVGLSAIIASSSAGINKYLNFQSTANAHKTSSAKFQSLANEIEYQLTIRRSQRQDSDVLMKECKQIYDQLRSDAPDIPDRIIDLYIKRFDKIGIAKPEIANGLSTIEIRRSTITNSFSRESSESPPSGGSPSELEEGKHKPHLESHGSIKNIVAFWKEQTPTSRTRAVEETGNAVPKLDITERIASRVKGV